MCGISSYNKGMEQTIFTTEPVYFNAQCACGHVIFEKFFIRAGSGKVRPFHWCGFCKTRKDYPLVDEKITTGVNND